MLRWKRQRSSTTTGKKGHFARERTEPKKVSILNNSAISYVCTHVFVAHTIPGWIVDSRETKHIASDRVGCVDYKKSWNLPAQIASGTYITSSLCASCTWCPM